MKHIITTGLGITNIQRLFLHSKHQVFGAIVELILTESMAMHGDQIPLFILQKVDIKNVKKSRSHFFIIH